MAEQLPKSGTLTFSEMSSVIKGTTTGPLKLSEISAAMDPNKIPAGDNVAPYGATETYGYPDVAITYEWDTTYSCEIALPPEPPVADAGINFSIVIRNSSLDGSNSFDPKGLTITYSWTQLSGPNNAIFSSKTISNPAISGLVIGNYEFELTVKNTDNLTHSDSVLLEVLEEPWVVIPTTLTFPTTEETLIAKVRQVEVINNTTSSITLSTGLVELPGSPAPSVASFSRLTSSTITIGAKGNAFIDIQFDPIGVGLQEGRLSILQNTTQETKNVTLRGDGAVVGSTWTLSPTSRVFPDTQINTTSDPVEFTLTNNSVELDYDIGLAVTSNLYAMYRVINSSPISVPAASSRTFSVVYEPTSLQYISTGSVSANFNTHYKYATVNGNPVERPIAVPDIHFDVDDPNCTVVSSDGALRLIKFIDKYNTNRFFESPDSYTNQTDLPQYMNVVGAPDYALYYWNIDDYNLTNSECLELFNPTGITRTIIIIAFVKDVTLYTSQASILTSSDLEFNYTYNGSLSGLDIVINGTKYTVYTDSTRNFVNQDAFLIGASFTSTNVRAIINGNIHTSSNMTIPAICVNRLGDKEKYPNNTWVFNGGFYEIRIYDKYLTDEELLDASNELNTKYNIW